MHFVKAKGILSSNNGINVYRGCTHGCIYCDSRSKCYDMKHEFTDIEVKENAPKLLEEALRKKRRQCMIGTGAMCDPYMHCERELGLTRKCLSIIEKYGFGATVQTKSADVLRDLDLFCKINKNARAVLQMTLTTFDDELCKIVESNVSVTSERFDALCQFRDAGIPTVVWISPILPFINDTEENLRGILDLCFRADVKGIICFGMGVTMREGNREYFYEKLDESFPCVREKYERRFGNSYECRSDRHAELMKILRTECRRHGVMFGADEVFSFIREFPDPYEGQMKIF